MCIRDSASEHHKVKVPSGVAKKVSSVESSGNVLHVYQPHDIANDDVWLEENSTLNKVDRAELVNSLSYLSQGGSTIGSMSDVFVPSGDGNFKSVNLYVMADQQAADLTNLSFHRPEDRKYSLRVLDNVPRLAILSLTPSESASCTAEECERHAKWVSYLALKQYNQMKGFLVSREPQEQMDQWETSRVAYLRSLPDVQYLPLE